MLMVSEPQAGTPSGGVDASSETEGFLLPSKLASSEANIYTQHTNLNDRQMGRVISPFMRVECMRSETARRKVQKEGE